ncbi:putative pectate lyase 17 [Curcuma longa]|uniref:putative pectate lyase 17 n=1 Tax=Curcuma longa TaxID=136217 RepID=UPI003D9F3685
MTMNRGRGVSSYVVTDSSDDPVRPRPGTLRYGATVLQGKVWITFARDMQIRLVRPLVVKSFTAIDGRGADVHIVNGAGFLLYKVQNVIIHGLQFHHLRSQARGPIIDPYGKLSHAGSEDGDAIRVVTASKVWIDHNTLHSCEDGLIDVTRGSTDITISNNWFHHHDKVMLLGHRDGYIRDKAMRVTVAFNRFGPACSQRMPRVRYGYAHVVNNLYDGWKEYAIGGSVGPTIMSEGNLFVASKQKEVTRRMPARKGKALAKSWNLRSEHDAFENGAFFRKSGAPVASPRYDAHQRFTAARPGAVRALTRNAGALRCSTKARC